MRAAQHRLEGCQLDRFFFILQARQKCRHDLVGGPTEPAQSFDRRRSDTDAVTGRPVLQQLQECRTVPVK